jgi:hypothetical protein
LTGIWEKLFILSDIQHDLTMGGTAGAHNELKVFDFSVFIFFSVIQVQNE